MFRGLVVLVVVSACAVGCAEECVSPASECPDSCRTVDGVAFDDAMTCWQLEETTLGCVEDDIVEAVETCVSRDSDGTLFRIGGITIPAGYKRAECDSQATFCEEPASQSVDTTEDVLAGLEHYFRAFSSADADTLAEALALPMLSATFPTVVVAATTATEYAQALWDSLTLQGWDRSQLEESSVVASSQNIAYVNVLYTRLTADEEVLSYGRGIYGLASLDGEWRVRSVMAIGNWSPDAPAPELVEEPDAAIPIEEYFAAVNARDLNAARATMRFPMARVAATGVELVADAAAFELDFDSLGEDWSQYRLERVEQLAYDRVTVAHHWVTASCLDAEGRPVGRHSGLYVTVFAAGAWKLQSINPTETHCEP